MPEQGEGIVQTTNVGRRRRKPQMARKSVGPRGLWGFNSPRPHQDTAREADFLKTRTGKIIPLWNYIDRTPFTCRILNPCHTRAWMSCSSWRKPTTASSLQSRPGTMASKIRFWSDWPSAGVWYGRQEVSIASRTTQRTDSLNTARLSCGHEPATAQNGPRSHTKRPCWFSDSRMLTLQKSILLYPNTPGCAGKDQAGL